MNGREPTEEETDRAEYDNPIIESLDRDLNAVLQRTDARLLIFLGIALVATRLPQYVSMPPAVESILLVIAAICIFGGIGFTIYSSVRGKRKVGDRYGVRCRACGFRPKINDIVNTADLGLCARCGAELRVRKP